jgi:hypothetical protein
MIDFRTLFTELVQIVETNDFPNADTISHALDIDVSAATIAKTKGGLLTIYDGRMGDKKTAVDVLAALKPMLSLDLLFSNSDIPYRDADGMVFGANQRLEQSKRSEGFAIIFQENGLTCGLTASSKYGVVQSLFCHAPQPARTAGVA